MHLSRRSVISGAGLLLARPQLVASQTAGDGFQVLQAHPSDLALLDNQSRSDAWIFGPGPAPAIIRAKQGQELKLQIVNGLTGEIWLHFFGVRGPSELMTINVPAGADQAVDCVFTPPDAGTFWIGPVADQSLLRDMGLYAMLIVEESNPLPGLGDLAIVVDDWKLEDGGAIAGDFGDIETMVGEGRLGNWFTVNNRYRPKLPLKPGQFTRLRLLNTANVRTMGLLFKGYDPLVIARDGQPIAPQPLGQKALMLAPGQRADLLVSPEEGDIRIALDLFEDIVEIAYLISEGTEKPPAIADNFALAPNPITPLPVVTDARAIGLRIEGGIKGGLKSARFQGVERDLRSLLENGKGWALNGVAGPAAEPLFTATLGEVILLEVDNRTAFSQALHIHGHVWQEIDDNLSGHWQDTAIIAAGEQVTLAFVAGNPGTWAIQSLVAERADGGMIGAFTVVDG